MKNDILATITQGSLRGIEEEGIMTFYRIPYGTNIGRFHEVGAALLGRVLVTQASLVPYFHRIRTGYLLSSVTSPKKKISRRMHSMLTSGYQV